MEDSLIYVNGKFYCEICLPYDIKTEDCIMITPNDKLDFIPVCEECGTTHNYMNLPMK